MIDLLVVGKSNQNFGRGQIFDKGQNANQGAGPNSAEQDFAQSQKQGAGPNFVGRKFA